MMEVRRQFRARICWKAVTAGLSRYEDRDSIARMSVYGSFRLLILAVFCALGSTERTDEPRLLNGSWWRPGGSTASNDTKPNSSCASYESCNSCNDASWCHWCVSDQACHAVGSIHGCIRGSDCSPPPAPKPPSNDSCSAFSNCADCARGSSSSPALSLAADESLGFSRCHWCAHDNSCHTIGSVYGCVAGVDCYSNDRCRRRQPEPLIQENTTHSIIDQVAMEVSQMGFFPLMVLMILTLSCICCCSLCFCISSGVKGAYDDLLAVYDSQNDQEEPQDAQRRPLLSAPEPVVQIALEDGTGDVTRTTEYVQLGEGSDHNDEEEQEQHQDGGILHEIDETNQLTAPLLIQSRRRQAPRHMQRLFNYCRLCYIVTIMTILGFSIATILYYPKIPSYNVCNDAVAWGSLIDSLTNMKATADFEILASVSNPNHFALALDKGMGSFTHNGAFVGTYDIPPIVVAPMAITDLLIVAHLAPDKWDALGLVAEYYRGKLVLYVDAEATLRIPMMANYTFTSALRNIVVNVNEQSERHLCSCPDWNDRKTTLEAVTAEDKTSGFLLSMPVFEEELA